MGGNIKKMRKLKTLILVNQKLYFKGFQIDLNLRPLCRQELLQMIFWSPVYAEGKVVYTTQYGQQTSVFVNQFQLMSRAGYECPGLLSVTAMLMSILQLEHSKLRELSKNEEEKNISSQVNFGIWLKINQILMV